MIYLATDNTTLLRSFSLPTSPWSISLQPYSQYSNATLYLITANTTLLWSILLQPILHCYNLSHLSQYYTNMNYLATANYIHVLHLITAITTLLYPISLQPILNCHDLSRHNQYYIAIIYSVQPILHCYDLSRYSQYYIAMTYSVTANNTLLWSISPQTILYCYDLSRYSQILHYYMILRYNTNKIYSTTDTITVILWWSWYNNKLCRYILLDTTRVMQYEYKSLSHSYPWTRRPPARCWRTPTDAHTRSG